MPHKLAEVANNLACLAARPNRRPTAEKQSLYDAFHRLPHACHAANHLACFAERPNRKQTAKKLHLHDAFYRLPCYQSSRLFSRKAKQEADGQKTTSARCLPPSAASPTISPVSPQAKQVADGRKTTSARCPSTVCRAANKLACLAAGETGGRRPKSYICTIHSTVCRATNHLASFADRRNRKQTAEKLHLHDALLPSAHRLPQPPTI